jgi:hypothetical protein
MKFKGIRKQISCANWEQLETLGKFWSDMSAVVSTDKLAGLGWEWKDDHFEYAIGLIDNFKELDLVKNSAIDGGEYFEIELPSDGWKTVRGKAKDLRKIYEEEFDCYDSKYKYEIEKFDSKGNCEISVWYPHGNA